MWYPPHRCAEGASVVRLRWRVSLVFFAATIAVVNDGPIPLGALIAGLLVQVVSLDAVLWIGIAGYALSPVVALLSPVRGLRRI